MEKKYLNISVLEAARERISFLFDAFQKICISFSGGKDSTVLLHLTMEEAKKRGRKVGVLFIDWEAQYKKTIDHVRNCFNQYSAWIKPYWVSLPLLTVNSCSMYEPEWVCWDSEKKDVWVREQEPESITDYNYFSFFYPKMTFEEFVPKFNIWYGEGQSSVNLIGIRTDESINRLRTICFSNKTCFENKRWTTGFNENTYAAFPIYDWRTEDIWKFHAKFPECSHNEIYELMYKAGLKISQMRICEPFSEQSKRGLWLYHILEPDTWVKLVSRVSGVNSSALYSKERGSIQGSAIISKPDSFSWKEYLEFLLESLPKKTSNHYRNKFFIYEKWCKEHGVEVKDFEEGDLGGKDMATYRRFCKCILKGDYWCSMLSFGPQKASNYEKYQKQVSELREREG